MGARWNVDRHGFYLARARVVFFLDLVRIIAAKRGEKVTRANDVGTNENQNNLFGFLEGRGALASLRSVGSKPEAHGLKSFDVRRDA
jgi:hypothetical protein